MVFAVLTFSLYFIFISFESQEERSDNVAFFMTLLFTVCFVGSIITSKYPSLFFAFCEMGIILFWSKIKKKLQAKNKM